MANIPIFNFMAKNVQFITVNYDKLSSKCQIGGANLEATTVIFMALLKALEGQSRMSF